MSRGRETGRVARRRRRLTGLALAASVLTFSMGAAAFASTLNDVIPPTGQVAGHSYVYWLKRVWKIYYSSPAPGPSSCETVTVGGKTVLLGEDVNGGRSSCHARAGKPIFIPALSTGCANVPGQHDGWGTSDSQLRQCSRMVTQRALISEFLDGRRVRNPNFGRYFWKPVGSFSVQMKAHRFGLSKPRSARAAAWGWALGLKGLPRGTHTVKTIARYPDKRLEYTAQIKLFVH